MDTVDRETRFLIVRHPETTANTTGRYVGRGDAPYTPLGESQAPLLSAEIVAWRPDRLCSSPLRRTKDVAVPAAEKLDCDVQIDDRLTELDFGQAEGLTLSEISAAGVVFDFESPVAPVAPGGESRTDIYRRSEAFALEHERLGGRVAVVTHGGVFRSLLVRLLGLELDDIWSFDIKPGQIAEVRLVNGHGALVSFRRPSGEDAGRDNKA